MTIINKSDLIKHYNNYKKELNIMKKYKIKNNLEYIENHIKYIDDLLLNSSNYNIILK